MHISAAAAAAAGSQQINLTQFVKQVPHRIVIRRQQRHHEPRLVQVLCFGCVGQHLHGPDELIEASGEAGVPQTGAAVAVAAADLAVAFGDLEDGLWARIVKWRVHEHC